MLTGFTHNKISLTDYQLDLLQAGEGPPLLLLHGFPQTKLAWHKIAPELAETYTVILPDLPGYGDSITPPTDADYKNYSKRAMANVLVEAMIQLGFDQFAVAGHDRGGRVAYRMALDHPEKISQLAVLNIIPTIEMLERIDYHVASEMENWFFLSQPAPYPETMIRSNPEYFLQHIFESWTEFPDRISAEAKAEYLRCFKKPGVVESICNEYRANKWDAKYDKNDRDKNNRIQCPVLALWSHEGIPASIVDPLDIWKKWAMKVTGKPLNGGHFLMEENPSEVLDNMLQFFNNKMSIEH